MLYIIPTPIGNLNDITKRSIDIIESLDCLFCENVSHSKMMFEKLNIKYPKLYKYTEYNEDRIIEYILSLLLQKQNVGLVSNAGYPVISDPGYKLVRALKERSLPYTVLSGATSIIPSLIYSALPPDKFVFIGFLPKSETKIISTINKFRGITVISFESPYRVIKTLKILKDNFLGMQITVCREISKIHEDIQSGDISSIYDYFLNIKSIKGELTLTFYID
ncbi:16S rRNA (cytidine(1402)-2'-O)-methyltransferase [Patescibacteria group bacterium]|nr:16S rRNA (cytidine(1402)-2'-O)-methyltransferase [Patescibacteria group bacterium]